MTLSKREKPRVLVIGGGPAGLTAAHELAQMGVEVLLIEKGPFVGGNGASLTCKATDRCLKCNDCLMEELLRTVSDETPFAVREGTTVADISRKGDGFQVSLVTAPPFIDPERCTDCGECVKACPESARGAILRTPSHHIRPLYAIDPALWRDLTEAERSACQSLCPQGAIRPDGSDEAWTAEVEGVVLAIGYGPYDPAESPRYNFHHFPNMVTGADLERMLRMDGEVCRPSDGRPPRDLAFIQCVGSRDARLNHEFCSRVCCGYALRIGLKLKHDHPEMKITVFYMDIQNFGKDFDRYYKEASNRMRFVRGLPGDFYPGEDARLRLSFYDEKRRKTVTETFDMVVLSVGIMPSRDVDFFSQKLRLTTNEDGFIAMPEDANGTGVVVAGTVEGPMDVAESIARAKRASIRMARYLGVVATVAESKSRQAA